MECPFVLFNWIIVVVVVVVVVVVDDDLVLKFLLWVSLSFLKTVYFVIL